jgi:hypothetical protein
LKAPNEEIELTRRRKKLIKRQKIKHVNNNTKETKG